MKYTIIYQFRPKALLSGVMPGKEKAKVIDAGSESEAERKFRSNTTTDGWVIVDNQSKQEDK